MTYKATTKHHRAPNVFLCQGKRFHSTCFDKGKKQFSATNKCKADQQVLQLSCADGSRGPGRSHREGLRDLFAEKFQKGFLIWSLKYWTI